MSGASGAVGTAVVEHLARCGLRVVASGRNQAALDQLARRCNVNGERVVVDVGPLEHDSDAERIVSAANRIGTIVLVCNASGTFGTICPPADIEPNDLESTLLVNTTGPIALSIRALRIMLDSGWGRIINVSSAQTLHPPDQFVLAYATSKHALNVATRCIAAQTAGSEVSACLVHPGNIKSAMWDEIRRGAATASAEHLSEWASNVDSDGGDEPELTAVLVEKIMDCRASWSNGRFLTIPGGFDVHPVPW